MVLYTDGAYENEVATWGAILLDPLSDARWMFHGTVCRTLCDHWRTHAGEQIICEVEAFAAALVLYGLRGSLRGRCIISFIDNDAARFGFVRRSSPSQCMFNIICIVTLLEAILETSLWYERVPSKSNPSDLPSRGALVEAAERFAVLDKGDVAISEHVLSRSGAKLTWCQSFINDVMWQLRLTFAGDDAVRRLRVPVDLSYLSPRVRMPLTGKEDECCV
ncbi:hypothetical protein AK812_SmicGene12112 [Symbiodinium microadriaticum]|uniref:RNase H type-1 domain-containing protein n=1 Tax=Symbiodinium microadriaticum TaxID=2951 RepID=A0A1Q9EBL1_SYMMI|nr:hypothetical protein AK812_SmicGene12112 [Symbiodinium microadriaticum]